MGGPIKRDRVWFFGSFRSGDNQQLQQGNYYNQRQGTLFYEPDLSQPAHTDQWSKDHTLRLTAQIGLKHKIVAASSAQPNCNCFFNLLAPTGGVPWAPEVTAQHRYNPQVNTNFSWRYPATNNVLFEVTYAFLTVNQQTKRQATTGLDVQVTDVGTNYRYGSRALNLGTTGSYIYVPRWQSQPGFTFSYVSGEHVFKAGTLLRYFHTGEASRNTDPNQINQGRDYTFRNGLPTNVRIWAVPYAWEEDGRDLSFFVQDQWTISRTTLNLGVRYNDASTSLPEVHLAPGYFVGARVLPAVKNQPHWKNLNPRVGVAYDLGGQGKTALKASLGRYNPVLRSTTTNPPAAGIAPSTNRTWNDANINFVPDCDLLNPNANGECGAWSDRTFGQNLIPTRNAPDAIEGFNRQDYNWQASASVQHELRPGIGVNFGYFRTWYGGFLTNGAGTPVVGFDNTLIGPSDFDEYCFTAPTDPRLPHSGERLCGLYDLKPAKFGLVDNLVTQQSNFGDRIAGLQRRRRHDECAVRRRRAALRRAEHRPHRRQQLRRHRLAAGRASGLLRNEADMGVWDAGEVPGCLPAAVGSADERHLPELRRRGEHADDHADQRADRAVARPQPGPVRYGGDLHGHRDRPAGTAGHDVGTPSTAG